jgi:Ca2+-binding RTX toxin-like protein
MLVGESGTDVAFGGPGDDWYFVDSVADASIEYADEGYDVVWTPVSYALAAGSEIEALTSRFWESTTAIDLFGNEIANVIYGNAGANYLDGGGGNDTIYGFEGNDRLLGGTGFDTLYGGAGDDNYFIEAGDSVVETGGQGFDIAWTSTSFTLLAGSEVEALSSRLWEDTSALNLTGNEIANSLYGNAGANTLDGLGGADSLFGFGGADSFRFSSTLGGGNIDTIAGFVAVDDTILLDDAIFSALPPGALNPNAFVIGAAALDADDRIIYNSATGALYYDSDGSGGGAAIQFATLQGAPAITASDFQVI